MDGQRTLSISSEEVKTHFQKLSEAEQTLADARMNNASLWKAFEDAGGNKAALKHAMKLAKQDAAKSADWQYHFDFYKETLGLSDQFDAFEPRVDPVLDAMKALNEPPEADSDEIDQVVNG